MPLLHRKSPSKQSCFPLCKPDNKFLKSYCTLKIIRLISELTCTPPPPQAGNCHGVLVPTTSYCFRHWAHIASSCALVAVHVTFSKFPGKKFACIWQALTTIHWFPRPPTSFHNWTPKLLSSCWWDTSKTSYLICRQKNVGFKCVTDS